MSKPRILAHGAALLRRVGLARVGVGMALSVLGAVAAFGLAPDTTLETVPTHIVSRDLQVPAVPAAPADAGFWREESVQRGDTVGSLLARLGVVDPVAQNFLRSSPDARALYQLKPGKTIRVSTDADGRLLTLRYASPRGDVVSVERSADRFDIRSAAPVTQSRLEMRAGEVTSSLFAAADAVALPDTVTMQLADVFSGDIDFLHDVRRGDRFSVVYEVRSVDGVDVGAGRIVAAEYSSANGAPYRAYLWRSSDGSENYYAEDGRSLRKAFLRSPLEFSRITSGFSFARFHPFMQAWRAHKGVDFAAPSGTAVRASGDGKVLFAGQQNGYGNVVMLQHHGGVSTVYAHLSSFSPAARLGLPIVQGEIIGYVGETGWATGPHLHYEFRVNNEQRDPLRIAFPDVQPIGPDEKAAYLERVAPLAAELTLGRGFTLAGAE